MARRKQRTGELVCTCRAYKFPHRLTGGRCTGRVWVAEFFADNAWGHCRSCHFCFVEDGFECEVVNGTEDPAECPEFSEYLDRNEVPVPRRYRRKRWQ